MLERIDRIRIIHSNKGVTKASNKDLRSTTGQWICFVDTDDEVMPGIIEALKMVEDRNRDIPVASYKKDDDLIVHDIFGYDVRMNWREKRAKMKALLKEDVIQRAVDKIKISDMRNMHSIPSVLFKYRLIGVGGY